MEKWREEETEGLSVSFYAGRLSKFYEQWLSITSSTTVLNWLKGYSLPLVKEPFQLQPLISNNFDANEQKIIETEILSLLKMGAIQKCNPTQKQFVSRIFLVDKPNGKKRFILNLKNLNKYVFAPHFKMEDARTASRLIQYKSYATTIDLKDAYYLLPVKKDHRKYLRFCYKTDFYEFVCLPFGLASAPHAFTKLLKPVVQFLRARGVLCVIYLDDFLILGLSKEECSKNTLMVTSLLKFLGFLINTEKSVLSPSTRYKYLGFIFDSTEMTMELPPDKREKIQIRILKIINCNSCKIIKFAKLLGLLTSACPAVKYGWLYTKLLERAKYHALLSNNQDYNAEMYISQEIKTDLKWWLAKVPNSKNDLKRDVFSLEIFTDASLSGWGVFCEGKTAFGWWTILDTDNHINYLELQAIFYGLKCFANRLSNCNILIRTDNTTALSYVNRMGSIKFPKLNALAREIWQWCENKNLWIFASYIPSSDNWQADEASRTLQTQTEWSLNSDFFIKIVDYYGMPEIDLFASLHNYKCKRYISWLLDPEAENIDAFTVHWGDLNFYAFPPFSLILRSLQKIVIDQASGILVVPFWESQPWYPLFLKLIDSNLIFLGPSDNMLVCPFSKRKHPLSNELILVAARLSGRRFGAVISPRTL